MPAVQATFTLSSSTSRLSRTLLTLIQADKYPVSRQVFAVRVGIYGLTCRWASLHPTVPAPQVPAQDRGSRDMPVPGSSASSCRCYGCRPIRRRHGAGSCRVSSTTVYCIRCRARHTRRFSFFHPHVTQSSNPVHVGLLGRRNAQPIIPADALRAPLNSALGVIKQRRL